MNKNDSHNGDDGRGTPIKVPEKTYQLTPAGFHPARCTGVADVGKHRYSDDGKKQPKVVITFEFPTLCRVFDEERGPEPPHHSIICTNSLGEKSKLYKTIVSWLGKGAIDRLREDLGLLAGEPCMANLIHETKAAGTREKIIDVTRVPEGMEVPPQISPSLNYSITEGAAGGRYDRLPAWIQKMILDSEEIDGPHPSRTETIERNVTRASQNAIAEAEQDDSNETDSDEESDESDFDLDNFSDAELRKPGAFEAIKQIIAELDWTDTEKADQYRLLSQMIRRARKFAPADGGDGGDTDKIPF